MHNIQENILNSFIYKIEPGITIELKNFLNANEQVKSYTINTKDEKYIIDILLNKFDNREVKDVFFSLLRFIEYVETYYTYERNIDNTTYYLLSKSINGELGFYFIIKFLKK